MKAYATGAVALLTVIVTATGPFAAPRDEAGSFKVITFEHPIREAHRLAVVRSGATVIAYEPRDSYIVWTTPAQAELLDRVGSLSSLTGRRKVAPSLRAPEPARLVLAELTVHPSALSIAQRAVEELGRVVSNTRSGRHLASIVAWVPGTAIDALASNPWVQFIGPGPRGFIAQDELGALTIGGAITDGRPTGEYEEVLKRFGLDGSGITVAIVDTGIADLHPDLEGRVVERFNYRSADQSGQDLYGHGTHVAAIVAGNPSGTGPLYEDPNGFAYGQGVAPGAMLVDQNTFGLGGHSIPDSDRLGGFDVLARDAWGAGARMWNGSWHTGEGNRVGYVASARRIDELTRDALGSTTGAQEFLFVFAAGNDGAEGMGAPHEAKNSVVVGATHSGRGTHYPLESDIDQIAPFSALGPTNDGRIFPTLVAPGAWLVSARAILPGTQPSACLGPAEALLLYCSKSGTSMAAPHVTGAAALIHQWWKRERGGLPSPAMVKAMLVNSADDIGEPDIPNNTEGWGRVDLGALFESKKAVLVDQNAILTRPGESRTYAVKVGADQNLKVTLAWTDAPAAVGAGQVLVNDLDLVVERIRAGRVVESWLGNVFDAGWSTGGTEADRKNNLENIFLQAPGAGTYRITVSGVNIPGDGVPGRGDGTDQDFALAATLN